MKTGTLFFGMHNEGMAAFRRNILPILGKKRSRDLRPVDIQAWVDDISQSGLSPATVGRCYRYLRACVRQAEAWKIIDHNPFKGIILPRVPRKELDFLNADEIRRLLDAARFPKKALFAVLALGGLHLGEALGLQWKDIDYEMRAIYVTKAYSYWGGIQEPKTESSRRAVTLLPVLADILSDYAAFLENTNPDDFLFQTRGQRPLDPANARKRFEATLARAGLKRVTLHSWRHSYASLMLSSGANIKALSHALGHASVTMTLNIYSHLIEERTDEAVARMDALSEGLRRGRWSPWGLGKGRGERGMRSDVVNPSSLNGPVRRLKPPAYFRHKSPAEAEKERPGREICPLSWENAGAPGRTRTFNLGIKSPLLCQIELRAHGIYYEFRCGKTQDAQPGIPRTHPLHPWDAPERVGPG